MNISLLHFLYTCRPFCSFQSLGIESVPSQGKQLYKECRNIVCVRLYQPKQTFTPLFVRPQRSNKVSTIMNINFYTYDRTESPTFQKCNCTAEDDWQEYFGMGAATSISLSETRSDRGGGWFYLTTAHDVLGTGMDATKYMKAV